MYVPAHFRSADRAHHLEVIRTCPLAMLVTQAADVPNVDHLPIIVWEDLGDAPAERDVPAEPGGPAAGLVLRGHMNRANPLWKALAGIPRALLVFTGPHGYISPVWYGFTPAAPTWNFVAVHARGRIRPIAGRAETLSVVKATVTAFETLAGTHWDMTDSVPYFERIVGGVGAFEFLVDDIQAMYKLSQDQQPQTRGTVAERFADSPVGLHQELARVMRAIAPAP